MAQLLFEIGMEEMPARFVAPAIGQISELAQKLLANAGLIGDDSAVKAYGTPRRLAVVVDGLAQRQPDMEEQFLGPPKANAFDANGNPTKAALGFAKSQGVEVGQLKSIDTAKGERLGYIKHVPGQDAEAVMPGILQKIVESLHFPKSMRWGAEQFRFARPIHWFVALLDGKVVPLEMTGIKSGNQTRGHRFMAPAAIEVTGGADYVEKLRQAHVLVDRDERIAATRAEVDKAAREAGFNLLDDETLLLENADLVEQPTACCGTFDEQFLEVPREVVVTAMREHQRYHSLEDDQGKLMAAFIAVNNTKPKDLAVVTAGHQKVLRARLADARFFLDEDRKRALIDFMDNLKPVTYHAKLGSSYEKVQRITAMAQWLAGVLAPELADKAQRAARLAKCDLVTEMVGEFPSLQGVVGADYARRDNEDPDVAAAIEEHYMPAGADAPLPQGMVGLLVGLADRLDTICGLFGVGEIPTGAADPYALRRTAIAVIRLITEKELTLSLGAALDKALAGLEGKLATPAEEVKAEVVKFFAARFSGLLADAGVPTDVAQAVLAVGLDDLSATAARAKALAAVKDSPDFAPLAAGMKRVMNILKKEADQVPDSAPQADVMTEDAERGLFGAFQALEGEAKELFAKGDYASFLKKLSELKGPIDAFFDNVMVMDKDEAVRRNRLAILSAVAGMFSGLAEFTYLQLA